MLRKILFVVVLGTFIVSFIQQMYDPYFYSGTTSSLSTTEEAGILGERIDNVGIVYRNISIYRGMRVNNHGWAIIILTLIFTSYYYKSKKRIILIFIGMIVISGLFSFSRYIWLGVLIASVGYIVFRKRKKLLIFAPILIIILLVVSQINLSTLSNNPYVKGRLLSKTYRSRIDDPKLYLTEYFPEKPLFGYGLSTGAGKYINFQYYNHVMHSMWFNMLFRNGLIGFFIYLAFLYYLSKRANSIYKVTKDPIFLIYIFIYFIINFLSAFTELDFYGNFVILLLMSMHYNVYVEPFKNTFSLNNNKKQFSKIYE
ncbi:O-antigen ligase family protein [Bacteroidota bacterium]